MENNSRIKALEGNATATAVNWVRNGASLAEMKSAVNAYLEAIGANQSLGNDKEAILLRRRAGVNRIDIDSIHLLTKQQEQTIHNKLTEIAEELPVSQRRHFRR